MRRERENAMGVETLRLDPASSKADSGGVAAYLIAASAASATSTYTYGFDRPQNSRTSGTDIASSP